MRFRIFPLLIFISLAPACLPAQETADSVLSKYIEAMGGSDRLKSIQSVRCSADIWINGLDGKMTLTAKWPSSTLMEFEYPHSKLKATSAGGTLWSDPPGWLERKRIDYKFPKGFTSNITVTKDPPWTDPPATPRGFGNPGDFIFSGLLSFALSPQKIGNIEYLGLREEEGITSHALKYLPSGQDVQETYFIDPQTFLPFKVSIESRSGGASEVRYIGGWYKEAQVSFNRRADFFRNGFLYESHAQRECLVNPQIADNVFAPEVARKGNKKK